MKPTRIIGEPKMTTKPDGTGRLIILNTDAGYMTVAQLAKAIGLSRDGVRGRAERFGWKSPRLFEPIHVDCKSDDSGNEEWRALGNRARNENLEKCRPIGTYDHIYHSGGCENVI